MMKAVLAFLFVSLAAASEQTSPVETWLGKYCDMLMSFVGRGVKTSDNWHEPLEGVMDELFAPEVNCSLGQYNHIAGYSLNHTRISNCMEAQAKWFAEANATQEIASMKCVNAVADEMSQSGAMQLELIESTGEFASKMAIAMNVTIDQGVASTYRIMIDRKMPRAAAGGVQRWLGKYCDVVEKFDWASAKTNNIWQVSDSRDFFAGKLTCSLDRFNGAVGYYLTSASYANCVDMHTQKFARAKNQEIVSMRCIEFVADERKKTGMMWLEVRTKGRSHEMLATMAGKVTIDNGRASKYNIVIDSQNFLVPDKMV